MSRLIDADALEPKFVHGRWDDTYVSNSELINAPTIEERERGRWMFSPDDAEGVCTVCQHKIYGRPYQGHYLIVPYNFCPNCGADMRGENNG